MRVKHNNHSITAASPQKNLSCKRGQNYYLKKQLGIIKIEDINSLLLCSTIKATMPYNN